MNMYMDGFNRDEQLEIAWNARHNEHLVTGFAFKLVAAWYHADDGNKRRLSEGFPFFGTAMKLLFMFPDMSWEVLNELLPEETIF